MALTVAFVQRGQIQREVPRWFTYLTDRTSGCIDKKSACYGRIVYWCTCLSHSSQTSQFIFCWNFHYFVSFTVYLRSFRSRVHSNSISVIIYLLINLVFSPPSISRYYFIVSLPLFAFLCKRNEASCNSADYLGFIYFFSHLNLGACAGFALANRVPK